MIENNFSRDIPQDAENLSPVLASMFGQLAMPHQYGRVMQDAFLSVNSQCPATVVQIGK